jgi:hypothetical protein
MAGPAKGRKSISRDRAGPTDHAHRAIRRPMIALVIASLIAAAVVFIFHLNGNM